MPKHFAPWPSPMAMPGRSNCVTRKPAERHDRYAVTPTFVTLKRTTISAYQVGERLARSIYLSGISLVFAIAIAIPLGVYQAVKRNTIGDNIATSLAFVTYSMPVFFLGLILSRSSPCPGPSRPRSASGASCPADQPAVRLPVPHPVPVRAGPVRRAGTRTALLRSRSRRRLPLPVADPRPGRHRVGCGRSGQGRAGCMTAGANRVPRRDLAPGGIGILPPAG